MQHLREFLRDAAREHARSRAERLRAALASFAFDPGRFAEQQFLRYVHYRELEKRFDAQPISGRVIEFGGSNGALRSLCAAADYEIAPGYPEVDVQDLSAYASDSYRAVIVDNVLEHVPDPQRAVAELHRVLAPGGLCVCTTPFLVRVHGYPDDYHRFTGSALARLFGRFGQVESDGWGNRYTLEVIHRYGWLSAKNTKRLMHVALWNEADWPLMYLTLATK